MNSARAQIARPLYLLVAVGSLMAGILGMVLPLLPTTPFLLLAAWAGGRGSPRFQRWLCGHRWFGPPIEAWRREGAVPRSAKVTATLMLACSWLGMVVMATPAIGLAVAAFGFVGLGAFLWSRPLPSARPSGVGAADDEDG